MMGDSVWMFRDWKVRLVRGTLLASVRSDDCAFSNKFALEFSMGFIDTLLRLILQKSYILTRIEEPLLLLRAQHIVSHLISQHDGIAN